MRSTRALLLVTLTACGTADTPPDGDDTTGGDATTGAPETGEPTTGAPGESTGEPGTTAPGETTGGETTGGETTGGGHSWPDPDDAPGYDGDAFTGMKIYDVAGDVWLDELALMEALDPVRLVFVGEQHEVAATHELELWVLTRLLARDDALALGMEQFQRDEQPILNDYLAGAIDAAEFEASAQPWDNYATYWKPLVEAMKAAGRPVLGLNVPEEAFDAIYGQFPAAPLSVFNAWDDSSPFDADLPPRPIGPWDAAYQAYFEGSYDYESHGKDWGLTYQEALDYFTDLALIRDDTMGYWIADHLNGSSDRVLVVAGDWHVHTGLATPDSAAKWADVDRRRITTATPATLDAVLADQTDGTIVADYVLVYTPG